MRSKKEKKKPAETDFPVGLSLAVILISIVFTIIVIHQSTSLMKKQYYLCELMETKKSLEQQNLTMVNDFNSLKSLDRIEDIATKEFNMARPDFEKNVVFLEVPQTPASSEEAENDISKVY